MKKIVILTASMLLSLLTLSAQEDAGKKGWVFTPMPDLGYNSDTGLNLGTFCDFFYYGDGTSYPNYLDRVSVAYCWTSKGAWYLHGLWDSKDAIDGLRLTLSSTYKDNTVNNFYGYNGLASPYDPLLDVNTETGTALYTTGRKMFRALGSVQGKITENLSWLTGLTFRRFVYSDTRADVYDKENTLYRKYMQYGLINDDEAAGGSSVELKAGLVYDSRDVEQAPHKGMYGELYLLGNKDISHKHYDFLKLVAHFRHFIPVANWFTVAYHLGYQGVVAGEQPFFMLQDISTLYYFDSDSEGLGSRYTVRGTLYDRLLGNGYAWSNFELRLRLFRFNLWKQYFEIITNPFFDAGAIVSPFRLDTQKAVTDPLVYSGVKDGVHLSAGVGLKLHMNTNFILSVEAGKAFEKQLANGLGVSLATTYVF